MTVELYESDDVTPFANFSLVNYIAGQESDVVEVHIWNNSGGTIFDLQFLMLTESLTTADLFLYSGIKPQDQLWGRYKVIGFDNTGDPTWSVANSPETPVGAYNSLLGGVPSLPDGCAVFLEVSAEIPFNAEEAITYNHRLLVVSNQFSFPIPGTVIQEGIDLGGNDSNTSVLEGMELYVDDSDLVTLRPGKYICLGEEIELESTIGYQLDDEDKDAVALAAGEKYLFSIYIDLVTKTMKLLKSAKYTSTTLFPATGNNFVLYQVLVEFTGGAPTIGTADIVKSFIYDRFKLIPNVGALTAVIHGGKVYLLNTARIRDDKKTLTFTLSTVSYVWITSAGEYLINTSEVKISLTDFLLYRVTTNGTEIIEVVDHRNLPIELVEKVSVNPIHWIEE